MESLYHQDLWQAYWFLLEVLYLETGCWCIYPPAPIPVLWDVKFPALLGFSFAQTNWVTMSSGETLRQKRKKMHNMLLNRRLSAWIQPSRNCIPQLELYITARTEIRAGPRHCEQEAKSLQVSPPLSGLISVCTLYVYIVT